MSYEKDSQKFWVETCETCKEHVKFLFINPTPEGMCTMIYNTKTQEKVNFRVYYNSCRPINKQEYVTYKLLDLLDG